MYARLKDIELLSGPMACDVDGEIDWGALQNRLEGMAEVYNVALSAELGELQIGGMLLGSSETTLFVSHPDHSHDYYYFCIRCQMQGRIGQVSVYTCGKSAQMNRESFSQNVRVFDGSGSRTVAAGLFRGGAFGVGAAVGGAVAGVGKAGFKALAKGINALMRDPAALEEEKAWYNTAIGMIGTLLEQLQS